MRFLHLLSREGAGEGWGQNLLEFAPETPGLQLVNNSACPVGHAGFFISSFVHSTFNFLLSSACVVFDLDLDTETAKWAQIGWGVSIGVINHCYMRRIFYWPIRYMLTLLKHLKLRMILIDMTFVLLLMGPPVPYETLLRFWYLPTVKMFWKICLLLHILTGVLRIIVGLKTHHFVYNVC